jgi:transglutaminase-like putative cysteine protease
LSKAIQEVNSGKKGNIAIIDIDSNYTNNGSTKIKADLNKDGYLALINTLINKSATNGKIPSYITTPIGNVSPNLYIFGLSKVLDFYRLNNRLPNYVTLNAKDVDGSASPDVDKKGNASQYKKGLNEVQSLSAAELAKYLTASGNDALNADIKALAKQLTQGKTTTWAKAQAIFNYVRDNIDYEYYANTKYKATGTLSKKRGNCCDHANLVVALCRAADIPARFSHAKNCRFRSGLVTGHVWAQIYVDGVWYTADATSKSNQLGNIQNWNTNSFTNLNQYIHLAF